MPCFDRKFSLIVAGNFKFNNSTNSNLTNYAKKNILKRMLKFFLSLMNMQIDFCYYSAFFLYLYWSEIIRCYLIDKSFSFPQRFRIAIVNDCKVTLTLRWKYLPIIATFCSRSQLSQIEQSLQNNFRH